MIPIQRSQLAALAVAFVVLVGATGGVAAQNENPAWGDELFEKVESMVDAYNQNADGVDLGPVSLEGATNVYVHHGDETATYTIYMDGDNRITDVKQGTDADAKRKMTMSKATLDAVATADDPAGAFVTAVETDAIVIEGESGEVVEQIKWTVINFAKGFLL